MTIRRALPEESTALKAITHDASRHWGYPEHWIKHADSDFDLSAEFISENEVYVAEESGKLQGFYALTGSDRSRLEHLCVSPEHFGTGVGKELFLHAMESLSTSHR